MATSCEHGFLVGTVTKHVRTNPFTGVKIDVPKAIVLREEGKAFKPKEIIQAASSFNSASPWVQPCAEIA